MKVEVVRRGATASHRRLVLIFSGWGTDSRFYADIAKEGWDIAVVTGYSDLDDISQVVRLSADYETVYVVAWSLGVAAASLCLDSIHPAVSVALAGTPLPVDRYFGIHPEIFRGTKDNLNERSLAKFRRRMFLSSSDYSAFAASEGLKTDIEELKSELSAFIEHKSLKDRKLGLANARKFNRVYITPKDAIFPKNSQINAWAGAGSVVILPESPHFVDLQRVIDAVIPDGEAVAKGFEKAVSTYTDAAVPQKSIAASLLEMLERFPVKQNGRVLEIGCGTGIFSRMYSELLKPSEIDYVDLYSVEPFGFAPKENYFVVDAEDVITTLEPDSYDYILSASAIHWLKNPARFLRRCADLLKPGGTMALSTFVKGNLHQLDGLRAPTLIYRSRPEIEGMLAETGLEIKEIYGERVEVCFKDWREAMLHLRKTGVSPATTHPERSGASLPKGITSISSLTYRPLYILLKKR